MRTQVLEESCNILLRCSQQDAVPSFDELAKRLQIAVVRFAGERAQPLLHAQIDLVVVQERKIACEVHRFDYPRPLTSLRTTEILPNHVHQGINFSNRNRILC